LTSIERSTIFTHDIALRIRAMLDLADCSAGLDHLVPTGWHFPLIGADTLRRNLRKDAFPGLGIALPDIGLPRLVAGGRVVEFLRPLEIGAALVRTSTITSVKHKDTKGGPLAIVAVEHLIRATGEQEAALREQQTFLLLNSRHVDRLDGEPAPEQPVLVSKRITPDDTMLFQFSALSFNSHKIHLDRTYARETEGFPDLVVNGGITTLLMTEMVRTDLGLQISAIKVTNKMPLFVDRPITIKAFQMEGGIRLIALNDHFQIAAEMEATTYDV
jgi:3-methylfumaryl-CoA hydratase